MDEETVLSVLRKIITIENMHGTDLIRISVIHSDRVSARDIAVEVLRSFFDYRVKSETLVLKKATEEFRNTISDQKVKVEQNQKKLADLEKVEPELINKEAYARELLAAKNDLLREHYLLR